MEIFEKIYLNIFVSIFVLRGLLPSPDKTLIMLINFSTISICQHIDIWNCSILFAKISFFKESSQHSHAYRMTSFTKESTSLRYVPIVFPYAMLKMFCNENYVFCLFKSGFQFQHIFSLVVQIKNLNRYIGLQFKFLLPYNKT